MPIKPAEAEDKGKGKHAAGKGKKESPGPENVAQISLDSHTACTHDTKLNNFRLQAPIIHEDLRGLQKALCAQPKSEQKNNIGSHLAA